MIKLPAIRPLQIRHFNHKTSTTIKPYGSTNPRRIFYTISK